MVIITLAEKIVVVSGDETFYGKVLIADEMNKTANDVYQAKVVGFISISSNKGVVANFFQGSAEKVNIPDHNILGVQPSVEIKKTEVINGSRVLSL